MTRLGLISVNNNFVA